MKFNIKNKEVEIVTYSHKTMYEWMLIPTIVFARDIYASNKNIKTSYFICILFLRYYFTIRFRIVKPF